MNQDCSVGLFAQVACLWEATARKPGNVHRYRDFEDSNYLDFLLSAAVIAPILDRAAGRRVGATALDGVRATRWLVAKNTNLGIILLLTPLAAVPPGQELRSGVVEILRGLDVEDTRAVFEAIRLAAPAGLGRVRAQDVYDEPTASLREVMSLAADRDLIARQYADDFADVFGAGLEGLRAGFALERSVEAALVYAHLHLMARHPDSLIARKRGVAEAEEAAGRARQVLAAGWPHSQSGRDALAELDDWLREQGRGRNPGSTADLVAASLFVALRERIMVLPLALPWSVGGAHV